MALQDAAIQEEAVDGEPGGSYCVPEGSLVESDRHFYMRRVTAERLAAARSVTEEGRQRRLVLVEAYLQKLQAMPA